MRLTKFGHACVRIEHDEVSVVVDPGMFATPDAVDGATAILLTHEHADHYVPELLRRSAAPIFTIQAVAAHITAGAPDLAEQITVVEPEQIFDVGLPVRAVGQWHEVVHPDLPRVHNCGYVIQAGERTIYHPGDALTVPGGPVDVLLGVVCAPWMRSRDGIDFARDVGAPLTLAIHDRVYSHAGLELVDGQFRALLGATGQEYLRLPDGADLPTA